jgi:endonuclease/exonuclease/phosphatase family metal-dependent hydrolase
MKLLTWNILAQATVPEALQAELAWANRLPSILQYLMSIRPDFICLQEVDLNSFESNFKSLLDVYTFQRHAVCMKGKHKRTSTFGNVTLWRTGDLVQTDEGSRSLHVVLKITEEETICISNVHFPAMPGLAGYYEKKKHYGSCAGRWAKLGCLNVILAGDFNDGLSFIDEDGKRAGLYMDVSCFGFQISEEELKKQTCKSFRGNIYNVDHVVSRANVVTKHIPQGFDVTTLPSASLPSDHLPVLYDVTISKILALAT